MIFVFLVSICEVKSSIRPVLTMRAQGTKIALEMSALLVKLQATIGK